VLPRTGRWVGTHPLAVVVLWVLLVAAGVGAALGAFGNEGLFERLGSGASSVPGEAQDGSALLEERAPSGRSVLLQLDGLGPAGPAAPGVQAPLAAGAADLAAIDGVVEVAAPLAAAGPAAAALTSTDGTSALVTAALDPALPDAEGEAAAEAVGVRLDALADEVAQAAPGSSGRVGSVAGLVDDVNAQVQDDLRTGEAVALPLSLLVMVIVFGGFLAAGIPVVGALVTIGGGLAALLGFSHLIDLDASVVNVVTVLGLGLCIDYGLLVVSRYREELRALADAGQPATERAVRTRALEATLAAAGRTVVFSAVTIAVSLCGLLVFRADILRSMGLASFSVVVLALLVALTLVPALLALGGAALARPGLATRVPGLRALARRTGDVAPEEGRFSALARRVQRRPWAVLVGVTAVLLVAASPVLSLQLRSDGVQLLPVGNPSREFFTDLEERFPAASSPAVTVVAEATPAQARAYAAELAAVPGVASVDPPTPVGDLVTLGVRVDGDPLGAAARDVVADLREQRPEFPTWVTGQAAAVVDFTAELTSRAPWAVALVVVATFALLFLMTGALLVPLKALLVNVLSLGASLGVVVWVFQEGHLAGPLSFTPTGGVETFVPPLVLAFGFGLAMDYEVFLLARILEARERGARTDAAVVLGLQRSGRIITSAALIIVLVFAGFVAGDLLAIKQVGLALAVAIAVDASLVRMLLVPAVMTLLGERNWWAPAPLRRLHARLGVREHG